jgi:hypothetical protein
MVLAATFAVWYCDWESQLQHDASAAAQTAALTA